jgi:hypothetical protein
MLTFLLFLFGCMGRPCFMGVAIHDMYLSLFITIREKYQKQNYHVFLETPFNTDTDQSRSSPIWIGTYRSRNPATANLGLHYGCTSKWLSLRLQTDHIRQSGSTMYDAACVIIEHSSKTLSRFLITTDRRLWFAMIGHALGKLFHCWLEIGAYTLIRLAAAGRYRSVSLWCPTDNHNCNKELLGIGW